MKPILMILLLTAIVFVAQFGGPVAMKAKKVRANRRGQK